MIFRKSKTADTNAPSGEEKPPVATPEQPAQANDEHTASVLTADVVMEGNLVTSGNLELNGTIHGAVQAAHVVIDVNGAVNGQVVAEEIVIRGRVIGPICGVRVHLLPGAQVEGDVLSHGIIVENGAFIDGQIRHSEDPLGEWQQMWYGGEDAGEGAAEADAASDNADEAGEASYLRRATGSASEDSAADEKEAEKQDEEAPSGES